MTVVSLVAAACFAADLPIPDLLTRLAEEAEVFSRTIERVIAEETIEQKALKARRPRLRIGEAAMREPDPEYQDRRLRSEFGYVTVGSGEAASFHEARQVREVDGKPVQTADKARRKLVSGIRSEDGRAKKEMLDELERHGLAGAATDFTLCLLLFRQREISNFEFKDLGIERVGAEAVRVLAFSQKSGDAAMTVFQGKEAVRQTLRGRLAIRSSDGLPLKIRLDSKLPAKPGEIPIEDMGEAQYARHASGVLLPVSAVHRRRRGALLVAEERFTYANFQRFSTESEIKFTPVEEEPK